jgi:hypothetical protein
MLYFRARTRIRAQPSGNYARIDMFKTRSGRQGMSDNVATAKIRIKIGPACVSRFSINKSMG